jgi:hypothetical protein
MIADNQEKNQEQPSDQDTNAQPEINKDTKQDSDKGAAIEKRQNYWIRLIDCIEKYDKVINATSTILIAFFTVILALATFFLYRATRDLVIGADEAAARQLRATSTLMAPMQDSGHRISQSD